MPRNIPWFVCLLLVLGGCVGTTYGPLGTEEPAVPVLERRVTYHLAPDYLIRAPRCAAVWTRPGAAPGGVTDAVARAVERHLATRFRRVLGPARTRGLARRLGIDLAEAQGRRVLARRASCEAFLEIRLDRVTDAYWVVFAERGIGLTLRLLRPGRPESLLWVARHSAARGDGGVPLSILSVPMSMARAALFNGDSEMFASIADDAVRRMTATLPDARPAWPERPAFRLGAAASGLRQPN